MNTSPPLLATSMFIFLSGCAGSPPAGDDAVRQRLAGIEARIGPTDAVQANAALLGELGRKLDTLAGEHGQLRGAVAGLALPQQALSGRITQTEQRIEALTGNVRPLQDSMKGQLAQADSLAARMAQLEKRMQEVGRLVEDALELAGSGQRKIFGKILFSTALTEDKTLFPINSPDLGTRDMAQLDALIPRLKELGTGYHLNIEGHTDGIGPEDYNYELGKARAEVVKRYLNEKWGVPLLRMSVTSHGATAATPGRPNRRIVVQVLQ